MFTGIQKALFLHTRAGHARACMVNFLYAAILQHVYSPSSKNIKNIKLSVCSSCSFQCFRHFCAGFNKLLLIFHKNKWHRNRNSPMVRCFSIYPRFMRFWFCFRLQFAGEKVLCFHGPLIYEAKALKSQVTKDKQVKYFIHYAGWNKK